MRVCGGRPRTSHHSPACMRAPAEADALEASAAAAAAAAAAIAAVPAIKARSPVAVGAGAAAEEAAAELCEDRSSPGACSVAPGDEVRLRKGVPMHMGPTGSPPKDGRRAVQALPTFDHKAFPGSTTGQKKVFPSSYPGAWSLAVPSQGVSWGRK